MNKDTGEFRHLTESEQPKPMEIPFEYGEIVEIKGQPFKVRSINITTHEITLRSIKYKPSFMEEALEAMEPPSDMRDKILQMHQKASNRLAKGKM